MKKSIRRIFASPRTTRSTSRNGRRSSIPLQVERRLSGDAAEHVAELSEQQQLLYASDRYALLLIFQAMDAAGKDGAIKHVMSGVNPQGCQVFSFKHPSPAELQHDFLWRTTRDLPERGRIGIFNRSYYEEVLILRVHPELLRSRSACRSAARRQDVLAWALSLDRQSRASSSRQRHADRQILPSSFEGGAAQALSRSHRRRRKKLEVQSRRYRGAQVLEGIPVCL